MNEGSLDEAHGVKKRLVRVFVSSTFRDMQAERDELAKRIFPELRRFCREREVDFVEVDLRWGVTEEQSRCGETLVVCLEEIDRCRPYFIALLGERYGFIPAVVSQAVITAFPWLEDYHGRSLTELEILHGVLNNPHMAERARFYFRSPAYAGERGPDFLSETPEAAQKLNRLKERIRASGLPLVEDYPDPQSVARQIGEDLRKAIAAEFLPLEALDALGREATQQAAFGLSRERVYIARQEYFDQLDQFIAQDFSEQDASHALVVHGESGCGKSALLSNWARRHAATHPQDYLLIHFIGSTPGSSEVAGMLQRILGELKRRFDIPEEIPTQVIPLQQAFPHWLSLAAQRLVRAAQQGKLPSPVRSVIEAISGKRETIPPKTPSPGRLILILDGLNQLEERQDTAGFGWLPEFFPPNVRVILSTLPGLGLAALRRRKHTSLAIGLLSVAERKQLIQAYLERYRKRVDPQRLEQIASAPACANPLYLRILLDELRLSGEHERLPEQIKYYLQAEDVERLFLKVLARLEFDYDPARRGLWKPSPDWQGGLVGQALGLIWGARRGVSESELLELLGNPPRAAWSPLFLALEESLLAREGVLSFFHDYLRQAVQKRYLATEMEQNQTRLRLADYFTGRLGSLGKPGVEHLQPGAPGEELPGLDQRALDELPWLLMMAGEWGRLYNVLADRRVFEQLWGEAEYDLKRYWAAMEEKSGFRSSEAYREVLQKPQDFPGVAWGVASLSTDLGKPEDALRIYEALASTYQDGQLLGPQAAVLNNQAILLYQRGDLDKALALYQRSANLSHILGDQKGLQIALGNQAVILMDHGDLEGALKVQQERQEICERIGDLEGLISALGIQALILKKRGDLGAALALHQEEERLSRQSGNLDNLFKSLGNHAEILRRQGDLKGALALHQEEERICRQLGNLEGLHNSLGNQGLILAEQGDLDGALALHQEKERICRKLGSLDGLQTALGNQANIYYLRGDLERALALNKEKEGLCRQLGKLDGLAAALGNQANIYYQGNDFDQAMPLYQEQERLYRQMGDLDGLQISLGNQALIRRGRRDLDGAQALLDEKIRLCRQLGNLNGLQTALGNQALILKERGDLKGAMRLHKEEEQICRQTGNLVGLQFSLGNQANILLEWDDLEGSLALHREEEGICRQLGLLDGLARSWVNQAAVLVKKGQRKAALELAEQALNLAQQYGYQRLAKEIARLILEWT